ncbi:hypothetical protein Tco_0224269, partial [Tanacetum coccineum]
NAQSEVDKDPFNVEKRKAVINILEEYTKVAIYELKKHKSSMESICDEDGTRHWGDDVAKQIVQHFQSFLGTSRLVSSFEQMGDIVNLKLSKEDAEGMIEEVSDYEIKEDLFDIDSSKASGPDGFRSFFFKKAWNIIGKEVCLAIREFSRNVKLLKEVNATLISL